MIDQLKEQQPAIQELCRQYGVKRLDVFGSAATGEFNPESSDFDFVIDFVEYIPGVATRFVEFAAELEDLLGRKVDFAFEGGMKPRFRKFIEQTREVLFEATHGSVAA